jgi:hypothetical protein
MRRRLALSLCLLLAAPASAAETPLAAPEFEALSIGRTLGYALGGEVYGAEQYLPGRRVLWAFRGEECRKGFWYDADGQICFVYDHDPAPQCWTYFRDGGGLRARFAGDPPGAEAATVSELPEAVVCPGPDVGV